MVSAWQVIDRAEPAVEGVGPVGLEIVGEAHDAVVGDRVVAVDTLVETALPDPPGWGGPHMLNSVIQHARWTGGPSASKTTAVPPRAVTISTRPPEGGWAWQKGHAQGRDRDDCVGVRAVGAYPHGEVSTEERGRRAEHARKAHRS